MHKSKFDAFWQELALVRGEIHEALHHLDEWMANDVVSNGPVNSFSTSYVQKDPLGVALVMSAWNYPILLQMQPVVGAIAAGNCVVIKPASYAKNVAACISRLVTKYLDPECIVAVEGNRHITNALLQEKFDMIFFTGSPFVGKVIAEAAAKTLTPVVLELGGKSPCVVDKSADVTIAARRAGWGALMNSGQTCVRPDYFLVHEDIADEFVSKLTKTITEFYGQDPQRSEWFGRLINASAFKRLAKCVETDKKYIVHGGEMDEADKYISPTVFDFGTDQAAFEASEVMQDEIFGPLIPIFRFRDYEEQVIQFIRERPKPLALYCFTTDGNRGEQILRLTSSGGAILNDVVVHLSNSMLPFGGVGDSGMGAYHGHRTFDCFTHHKAVVKRSNFGDVPMRYPPYSVSDQKIMRSALRPHVATYYNLLVNLIFDKKNVALFLLCLYLIRSKLSSRI